jgi:hypothetical protein
MILGDKVYSKSRCPGNNVPLLMRASSKGCSKPIRNPDDDGEENWDI